MHADWLKDLGLPFAAGGGTFSAVAQATHDPSMATGAGAVVTLLTVGWRVLRYVHKRVVDAEAARRVEREQEHGRQKLRDQLLLRMARGQERLIVFLEARFAGDGGPQFDRRERTDPEAKSVEQALGIRKPPDTGSFRLDEVSVDEGVTPPQGTRARRP